MASASCVVLECISLSFTPKLDLLPYGHPRVDLDVEMLQPLPTWLNVKPCHNQVRWCTRILYINDLSKWWLTSTKLSNNPGWLNSYECFSTLLHTCTACFLYMYCVFLHFQTIFIATMPYQTWCRWQDVMAFAYLTPCEALCHLAQTIHQHPLHQQAFQVATY